MGAQAQQSESPHGGGFASILANLAAPQPSPAPRWEDELEDDVATLSYEQALKTHARYHTPVDRPMPPASETLDGAARFEAERTPPVVFPAPPLQRELKVASITIRMSHAESEQLRKRATDAGLTISAYLRSCTFEVETLREMVKQTLAQLKAATDKQKQQEQQQKKPRVQWLRKLLHLRQAA
jgi:hypothetical protein